MPSSSSHILRVSLSQLESIYTQTASKEAKDRLAHVLLQELHKSKGLTMSPHLATQFYG
ncbi:MAG: hypothetical protein HRT83_03500 [Hyphomicrobiaceae bacterium]|nr:hypothetical protein [Hyphomicrobiaceae bacterium]